MSSRNQPQPTIDMELYLLKQHSPANNAAYNKLDYIAFGYFDGIVWGKTGFFKRENYADFDYDCFDLASYEKLKTRFKHLDKSTSTSVDQPYFMVTMLQLLPFCEKRCGDMSMYDLLSHVSDAYEKAIDDSSSTYSDALISYYPYFSYGQVDIVIITRGNSLTYMYNVLERLMHNTRYETNCYGKTGGRNACKQGLCFTSSYSVCGILSAKDKLLQDHNIAKDSYEDFYKYIARYIHNCDYCDDTCLSFLYETYVKNSNGTKAYLAKYFADNDIKTETLGLVGNYDYAYVIKPNSKEKLAKALYLTSSICDENPHIAGTALEIHIKINEPSSDNENDLGNKTTFSSKQPCDEDNRKFEKVFWALYHLDKACEDPSLPIEEVAKELKTNKFNLFNATNQTDDWATNEWKTLALELDEMNSFCFQLAHSHFSSGVGTMLLQPLNCLYDIYDRALKYLIDLAPGMDDEAISNPLQKDELASFMNSINIILSSLMLSTNSIIETRDYHSCELNAHTKYLVAYYVFMKSVFESIEYNKTVEVLITTTNDLRTSVKKILQKYCIFPHSEKPHGLYILNIPMLHLKNPLVMFPILLHEAAHMKGDVSCDVDRQIKKKCMFDVLVEAITAGLCPEGVMAKDSLRLEDLDINVNDFNNRVVLSSDMFGDLSDKIEENCKVAVRTAYLQIKDRVEEEVKDIIKTELRIDVNDRCQEVLLGEYNTLFAHGKFFTISSYGEPFRSQISTIIRRCQVDIMKGIISLIEKTSNPISSIGSLYAVCDALFVSENAPLLTPSFPSPKIDMTTCDDEKAGLQPRKIPIELSNVCYEMIKAANEIYADICMICALKITSKNQSKLYLKCFTDEDWISLQNNLGNIFRVCYILEFFYKLSRDEIKRRLHNRVDDLDIDVTSIDHMFYDSTYYRGKHLLTVHELFSPIFKKYIDDIGSFWADRSRVIDTTGIYSSWRGNNKRSTWNENVVYKLWSDLRKARQWDEIQPNK